MKGTIKIYEMNRYYKKYPVKKLQMFIMKYLKDYPDEIDDEIEKAGEKNNDIDENL